MEIHHFALCPHRNVRFLSIINNDTTIFIKTFHMCRGIPLFLGKDVLDGICIQGKNHARIHARFAKDGVAVKLNLCEFGIEGINNSKALYFYSIQGLFQAVFEYHSIEVQRECLLKLRDLWLNHHTDPLLPESIHIRYVATSVDHMGCDKVPEGSLDGVQKDQQSRGMISGQKHGSQCDLSANNMQSMSKQMEASENINQLMSCAYSLSASHTSSSPSNELTNRLPNVCPPSVEVTDGVCSKNDIPIVCAHNQRKKRTLRGDIPPMLKDSKDEHGEMEMLTQHRDVLDRPTLLEHVEIMIHDIKLLQTKEKSHSQTMTRLANTLLLLNFVKCEIFGDHFNPQNSFPLQLLEKYLATVQGGSMKILSNNFGIPCRREAALNIISDWLGKQFHRMEAAISLKVDQFKKDHITCIDNLPPSDKITDMLFPSCMRQLISNWIGQENIGTEYAAASDHDYGPPQKRIRGHATQKASLYPVIQLLLEFANNALVSGVAHVVYSRLLHSL